MGLVTNLDELVRHPGSGHAVFMGNQRLDSQDTKEILERFGKRLFRARQNYRQFIFDGVTMGRRNDLVGGGLKRRQWLWGQDLKV